MFSFLTALCLYKLKEMGIGWWKVQQQQLKEKKKTQTECWSADVGKMGITFVLVFVHCFVSLEKNRLT